MTTVTLDLQCTDANGEVARLIIDTLPREGRVGKDVLEGLYWACVTKREQSSVFSDLANALEGCCNLRTRPDAR